MEINMKDEIFRRCSDLITEVKWARTLVEEGKEVPCYRKLQGVSTKLLSMVDFIKTIPNDILIETSENVAKTTD